MRIIRDQHQIRFLLVLIAVSVFGGCAPRPEVEGTYLRQGVGSYIMIERNNKGQLEVRSSVSYEPKDWVVTSRRGKLRLSQQIWNKKYNVIDLIPSKTIPGDWDLVGYSNEIENPDDETPWPKQIVSSYLHRIEDSRVVEYFKAVKKKEGAEGSSVDPDLIKKLASELVESHPDDPYIRMIYIDMLMRCKELEQLEKAYENWEKDYSDNLDPVFDRFRKIVEWNIESIRLSRAGKNGYDFWNELLSLEIDLNTRLKQLPELLNYEKSIRPCYVVGFDSIPNFLEIQTSAKVFRMESIFYMIHGEQDEALSILASVIWLGQMLNDEAFLIDRLIGIAIRGIGSWGMSIYTLNACENEQDFEALWEVLEKLENHQKEIQEEDLFRFEMDLDTLGSNTAQVLTRHHVANAKFENVRMAAAVKYRLLKEDRFPLNHNEFAPFLKERLPQDPFTSSPMRFISSQDQLVCYSVGPDQQDDSAKIEYDPTNGTTSGGDITLRVPREREFPFPEAGVRANTAEEFRKQFPNGLPRDVFGGRRPAPQSLKISNTTPLYIYSIGPDLDEDTGNHLSRFTPEFHYDPTNGTISKGDLFFRIQGTEDR